MQEIKSFILSNGQMIEVLKRDPAKLRFEIKTAKQTLVKFYVETTWLSTKAVLNILSLERDSLEPYLGRPVQWKGFDPDEYIPVATLILWCKKEIKSISPEKRLIVAELLSLN
ncbi:MAG: hypothetical protein ACTHM5_03790 [Ginsengibacter sp.]